MSNSSITRRSRNSTIEALKLFLMFGVVVLHICGGHGNAIELSQGGIYRCLERFFLCSGLFYANKWLLSVYL